MRETRVASFDNVGVHYRAEDDEDGGPIFYGHAAVFSTPTIIGSKRWGFVEEIAPGAFTDALTRSDVRFLHNHDPNILLGRTTNGTLRLSQDNLGLEVRNDFPDTSQARDIAVLLERRDLTQMSFAFTMEGGTEQWSVFDDDHPEFAGMEHRLIVQFGELFDVSTVVYPAFPTTDAGLRAEVSEEEVRALLEAHRVSEPAESDTLSPSKRRERELTLWAHRL